MGRTGGTEGSVGSTEDKTKRPPHQERLRRMRARMAAMDAVHETGEARRYGLRVIEGERERIVTEDGEVLWESDWITDNIGD